MCANGLLRLSTPRTLLAVVRASAGYCPPLEFSTAVETLDDIKDWRVLNLTETFYSTVKTFDKARLTPTLGRRGINMKKIIVVAHSDEVSRNRPAICFLFLPQAADLEALCEHHSLYLPFCYFHSLRAAKTTEVNLQRPIPAQRFPRYDNLVI